MERETLVRAARGMTAVWDTLPTEFQAAVAACASGSLPPAIAFMQICMAAPRAQDVVAVLDHLDATQAEHATVAALVCLGRSRPQAWALIHTMLDAVSHETRPDETAQNAVLRYAASFDRAAAIAPEASVALYSLGDADALAAATAEIVACLKQWGLVARDRVWLDIGCGIGRFEQALSPDVAAITGIDVSTRMVAEATHRCATLANVTIAPTSGLELAAFGPASFDAILAVDAFPYLVQPDPALAATHIAESARVLRPGGHLAIFNYSYRGDPAADHRDVAALAERNGFSQRRVGERDCPSWDGVTFLLQRK